MHGAHHPGVGALPPFEPQRIRGRPAGKYYHNVHVQYDNIVRPRHPARTRAADHLVAWLAFGLPLFPGFLGGLMGMIVMVTNLTIFVRSVGWFP